MWLHLPYVLQIAWLCSYYKVDSVGYHLEYKDMQELVAELSHSIHDQSEEVKSALQDMLVLLPPATGCCEVESAYHQS